MIENDLPSSGFAEPEPDHVELSGTAADFSSRCMALLIDAVFLSCLVGFTLFLFVRVVMVQPPATWQSLFYLLISSMALFMVWPLFLAAFYFIVLHSFGGQTLGKVFMGIRVVSDQGSMLSIGSSFLRLVGYLLSTVPLGAGFLWAAVDQQHSAWHDKLACSRVIYL
ncbi:MAG: RDD family protein [Proteobacteria bacterium]|nr:RDD family protein [Pseudomonadota bacterium]